MTSCICAPMASPQLMIEMTKLGKLLLPEPSSGPLIKLSLSNYYTDSMDPERMKFKGKK